MGTTYNLTSVSKTEAVGTPGRGSLATSQAYGKHKRSVLQGPVTITQVENTSGQYSWVQPTTSQVYRKQKRLVLPGEGRLQPHKRMGQSPQYNLTSVWKTQAVSTPRVSRLQHHKCSENSSGRYSEDRLQYHKCSENTNSLDSEGSLAIPQAYGKHKRSVLRGSPRVAYKLTSVWKTQAVSTPWVAYNLTSVAKTQTV